MGQEVRPSKCGLGEAKWDPFGLKATLETEGGYSKHLR